MHELTHLCGSLGLPTLCPGCTLRRRPSRNPLRFSCSISCRKEKRKESWLKIQHIKKCFTPPHRATGSLINYHYHSTLSRSSHLLPSSLLHLLHCWTASGSLCFDLWPYAQVWSSPRHCLDTCSLLPLSSSPYSHHRPPLTFVLASSCRWAPGLRGEPPCPGTFRTVCIIYHLAIQTSWMTLWEM